MQLRSISRMVRGERPTLTALILEIVALRHQIAVLKRSGTRRPCFRLRDRLFWIWLARWWPGWRDSLVIVQPATVLRWRRSGWSGLWRYRSRGRWRGGRPRIEREVRQLIVRMARENFLWGAPRIHGELSLLGFTVSQATVSRYMPAASRHWHAIFQVIDTWTTTTQKPVQVQNTRRNGLDDGWSCCSSRSSFRPRPEYFFLKM
jgi:hypothetical protein